MKCNIYFKLNYIFHRNARILSAKNSFDNREKGIEDLADQVLQSKNTKRRL